MGRSCEEALAQIKKKNYMQRVENDRGSPADWK